MSKRILVLGASGFIGSYLFDRLTTHGHFVTGTYVQRQKSGLEHINLLNLEKLTSFLKRVRPELVVFLSGTKDVTRCEQDPAHALDLNVQAVRNYLTVCKTNGLQPATLYFSSDYVFDGVTGYYTNTSPLGPKTVYGATKMIAERLFLASDMSTLILRVSAVMGRKAGFFNWLEKSLETETPIGLFDNTYFSPTSIGRLCDFVVNVADNGIGKGVQIAHLSDGYRMSRVEFGGLLALKLNKSKSLISVIKASVDGIGFQADLSLLPDGMNKFLDNQLFGEFKEIF